MAGYDQNPQFPGSQSGFPAQAPGIPAVPSAGSNPQAIGGGSIPVAAPLSPVVQAIPLAQPIPVQPAGRQPLPAYPAPVHGNPEYVAQAPGPTGAKRRASAARPVSIQPAGSAASVPMTAQPIPVPAATVGATFGLPLIRTESDEDEEAEEVTDKAVRRAAVDGQRRRSHDCADRDGRLVLGEQPGKQGAD